MATNVALIEFISTHLKSCFTENVWKSCTDWLLLAYRKEEKISDLDLMKRIDCSTDSWLLWAKSHPNLKIVTADVPDDILPDGISGRLLDVKINFRGPDDVIYDKDAEIRQKVARGNSFLELTNQNSSQVITRCIIYGLKKFTGGLGDDDDRDKGDDYTWKMYFTKPLDESRSVICTRKVNGEAAHFSVTSIFGHRYFCAGSKNVHMIFRSREDLNKYDLKASRYTIALEICRCLLDFFDSMSEKRKEMFFEFLLVYQLTAIFEILNPNHPHVEDISFLSFPQMKFITWTSNILISNSADDNNSSFQLSTFAPDVSIEIARCFGLSTVDYEVIDTEELDERMNMVRNYYDREGEVFFFVDCHRNVIGMLKKKSIWYIIVRAIREKIRTTCNKYLKNPSTFQLKQENEKIEKRINEIQTWLGIDDEAVKEWKKLGKDFLEWIIEKLRCNQLSTEAALTMFPLHWKTFLREQERTDKIGIKDK